MKSMSECSTADFQRSERVWRGRPAETEITQEQRRIVAENSSVSFHASFYAAGEVRAAEAA